MKLMLKMACGALIAAAASAPALNQASAADLAAPEVIDVTKSPIDVSFGVKLATEYNLRSVSQTKGHPAVQGYAEISFYDWAYAGVWASNVDFGGTDPSAEVDYYAGLRHTWDGLTLDGGFLYIDYVGEKSGLHELDFWKIYGSVKYAFNENLTIGANLYWTSDFIGYSKIDGTHSSLFAKYTLPPISGIPSDIGFYVSGEVGKQWVSKNFAPDYVFWNAGVGLTYKAMTVDLRYTDSDLSRRECNLFIGQRSSCGSRYMASISFDTSLSKIK